jgi:hypothetical protein
VGGYAHFLAHEEQRLFKAWYQVLVLACVGLLDVWHRAFCAQSGTPIQVGSLQQAAAFYVAPAMVIPEKMAAFFACGSEHGERL